MSVVAQLPPDLGGAAGKVRSLGIQVFVRHDDICAGSIYRH